jgi:hypothetical protein
MQKNTTNSYDEIKGMLNTMRKFNKPTSNRNLREQAELGTNPTPTNPQPQQGAGDEKKDFTIVNGVEVRFNSTDTQDLQMKDDEKTKVSALIDAFRNEVSEIAELGQMMVYPDSVKLEGVIGNFNINFTLSAGDDNGVYISNASLLKLSDEVMEILNKLKRFEMKFTDEMNNLILTRRQN